jgi:hypothetical protein
MLLLFPTSLQSVGQTFTVQSENTPQALFFYSRILNTVKGYLESKSVASPDAYTLIEESPLEIPAPGVLANDEIQRGHTPQAVLAESPRHGTVILASNGAFTYTPDSGFFGEDSFRYLIRTNNGDSNDAPVTIAVPDRVAPTVAWLSPGGNGEIVYVQGEPVTLEVNASDNATVESVTFLRWDAVQEQFITLGIVETRPYRLVFNTGELNPEWNQVFAIAFDQAKNQSNREFIWLYRGTPPNLTFKIFLTTLSH